MRTFKAKNKGSTRLTIGTISAAFAISTALAPAAIAQTGPSQSSGALESKSLENMTADEVAKIPLLTAFRKGAAWSPRLSKAPLEPSRDEQWIKNTSDGKVYVLTIHYDKNGKMAYAKWGGF